MDPVTPERGGGEGSNRWFLEYVELENFKSYAGNVRVGPFKDFIAVIGPNGSGKSNLLDAISFVTGDKSSSLRVRRLDQLIHGAAVGKPVSNTARVTAIFKTVSEEDLIDSGVENDNRKTFSRVIKGASSEYIYNGTNVSQQEYLDELKEIGINPKAKNFMVFQGEIENIAMKNAKERTTLLEEMCGSAALKDDYEKAKAEMTEAEKKMEAVYSKRKNIIAERKCVRQEVNHATSYRNLMKEVDAKEQELALFKLHYLMQEIDSLGSDKCRNAKQASTLKAVKRNEEAVLAGLKRERGELNRALATKEATLQNREKERDSKAPKDKLTALQQTAKHLEKKLASAEASLKKAKENKLAQGQDLDGLQEKLEEAEKMEEELLREQEGTMRSQLDSQGRHDLTFRDSDINEYWQLKQQVSAETTLELKQKDSMERKLKDKNELFLSLDKQKMDLKTKIDLLKQEIDLKGKSMKKIIETVNDLKTQLESKESEAGPMREKFNDAQERGKVLQAELKQVRSELDSMKMDRNELERKRKKAEVLDALKKRFKGVIDRVNKLCKPRHNRYKNAITKIMGGMMEAIVVDTEKTARECIQYLKEQMFSPESFIALDFIVVQPPKDRFRSQVNNNIHLAIDLLNYDKTVEKAMLFCMKNDIVCDTPEVASKVANGEVFNGQRVNAVSLDGTHFFTSGIISGGLADLERKARNWNDEDLASKEGRRNKIMEELTETLRTLKIRRDVDDLDQEIVGLKARLKHANEDLKIRVNDIKKTEQQKEILEKELVDVSTRWSTAETTLLEAKQKMDDIQKKIDEKEDTIFRSFCQEIGIPSIRVYEEREVKEQEEFKRKREELANEIERIRANIAFEMDNGKSFDENIRRWTKTVADIKKNIKETQKEEKKMLEIIAGFEEELAKWREEIDSAKQEVEEKEKEVKASNKKLSNYDKAILGTQKEVVRLETCIAQKKAEQRDVMRHSRLNGIDIPLRANVSASASAEVEVTTEELEIVWEEHAGREDELSINFGGLRDDLKHFGGDEEGYKKAEEGLHEKISELENQIAKIEAPNLKANERLGAITKKFEDVKKEFDEARKRTTAARAAFNEVKTERTNKFNECFKKISENIDGIYKALTQNSSAQAILDLDNVEEPYLGGVSYHCVAPGKRFQPMNNMSGGEKTLAALALLFAIHRFETSHILVLDEIDAALDNTNISKVSEYFKQKRGELQVVVISLKEEFFYHADALFGVTPAYEEVIQGDSSSSSSQNDCAVSQVLSLDLTPYDNPEA